ncbi:MAG: type I restriction-modification system subunit M [Treponema sp.]|nr:type I restriction-modification system subunit M [Treponema sp.]
MAIKKKKEVKTFVSQQSLNSEIKSICDIMRRSNCAGAMQYVPELTWLLFLRILDANELNEINEAKVLGINFNPSLKSPYRWGDWGNKNGKHRNKLIEGTIGSYFDFINTKLIPHLKSLRNLPDATPRQKVISEIMSGVDRVRIDTEKNFLDVCDKIDEITNDSVDDTHIFTLSQIYEGLLLKMGEKGNDGGQFFTPREVIRAMVKTINPTVGETVYDPCCGTGGFLVQSYLHMLDSAKNNSNSLHTLKHDTIFGREKENLIYPITLANMILHGIEQPAIWHGNTLTGNEIFGGLFTSLSNKYDVILTNPPFGGKEGKEAQTNFAYKTGATQILFLQHVIDSLKDKGRCGIVIDEGVLFRSNENAFVQTKRKLIDECNVYCIVSLPHGVFSSAGAGVKANILFFEKGSKTKNIWYYDLSGIKVGKRLPFTIDSFDDFFKYLPKKSNSYRSWTVDRDTIEKNNFDLKAVNPNRKIEEDTRTPEELIALIEQGQKEINEALKELKK